MKTTKANGKTKGRSKLRVCVMLPQAVDQELTALAITLGISRSELVERGLRLLGQSLPAKTMDAVARVRGIVAGRETAATAAREGAA